MQLADITTNFRAKIVIDTVSNYIVKNSKILDIGCGNGIISKIFQDHFQINLIGCDRYEYLSRKIRFKAMRYENKLDFSNNEFDISMFLDVLHHIPYPVQEDLLIESLRVSNMVLIFELNPTLLGKFLDWTLNKIHYWNMPIPFTYRNRQEWEELFEQHKLKYQSISVITPRLYPFSHTLYVITK